MALCVLLGLIPLRAILNETHTFEVPRLFRNLDAPEATQPGCTFVIITVIALVAVLVTVSRLWRGRPLRFTGAEIGFLLLILAAIVSTLSAGQKHLALIGTLDFLFMLVYMFILRQLLRRRWQIRLALIVVLATGGMVLTKGAYQHLREIPDMIEFYEENKEELTRPQGALEPGPRSKGLQHDYEQRLRARSITGYYGHPNILGSHMILFIMTGIAMAAGRFGSGRPRWTLILPLIIPVGGLTVLSGTQSKGAMAACGVAIAVYLAGHFGRSFFGRRRTLVLACGCLLAVGACAALALVLRSNPQALGRSIFFRYMYWQGAAEMIGDQGWMGVGANNFGRLFTRYKAVECPEEVESPHSWPVQFASEWGLVGLVGFLLVMLGVSRRFTLKGMAEPHKELSGVPPPGSGIVWSAALGAFIFLGWLLVLSGSDVVYIATVLLVAAPAWFCFFILLCFEGQGMPTLTDGDLGPVSIALCAGLIGFLVHTGIDLALFVPGPATTFFAVIAIALAAHAQTEGQDTPQTLVPSRPRRRLAMLVAGGAMVLIAPLLVWLVIPTVKVANDLSYARLNSPRSPWNTYATSGGYQAYARAASEYPLDPTALTELVEELIARVQNSEQIDRVMKLALTLQKRDPASGLPLQHLGRLKYYRYRAGKDLADYRQAIEYGRKSLATYPTSPHRRLELARLLEEYASISGDASYAQMAAEELQTVLDLESRRVYVSKANRLPQEQVEAIQRKIEALRSRQRPSA